MGSICQFCFERLETKYYILWMLMGMESYLQGLASTVWCEANRQNKDWPSTQPYEYSNYNSSDEQSLIFDSYMILEDDFELNKLCYFEVDNWVVISTRIHLRMIITFADVLHS
jgi:hypothetical protein